MMKLEYKSNTIITERSQFFGRKRIYFNPIQVNFAPVCPVECSQDMQKRAFAGTIFPDDANNLPSLDFKADVPEGPELFDFITLNDLSPAKHIPCLAREIHDLPRHHVA